MVAWRGPGRHEDLEERSPWRGRDDGGTARVAITPAGRYRPHHDHRIARIDRVPDDRVGLAPGRSVAAGGTGSVIRRLATGLVAIAIAFAPVGAGHVLAGTNGIAYDDDYEVFEDHELVVAAPGVLANDYPPDSCVISTDDFGLAGSVGLGVGADGHFRFTPTGDFNGSTFFTYVMGQDSGGCPAGQADTGQVNIVVRKVNDPPSVVKEAPCSGGIVVAEDSGPYDDAPHCVQMLDFGPPDENNQNFSAWLVSSTHPELFEKKPSVERVDGLFGRLRFTPAKDANGTSTVSIRGRDTGGTENGGDNTSNAVKVKITITAVADPVTPGPPTEAPTDVPTAEPTAAVGTEAPSAGATPAPPALPSPDATAVPASTGTDAGGIPIALLLSILLVVLVVGFVAAMWLPRWRAGRRT